MRGWEDRRVRGCNKRRVNDGRVRGDEDGSRVGAKGLTMLSQLIRENRSAS